MPTQLTQWVFFPFFPCFSLLIIHRPFLTTQAHAETTANTPAHLTSWVFIFILVFYLRFTSLIIYRPSTAQAPPDAATTATVPTQLTATTAATLPIQLTPCVFFFFISSYWLIVW
jgi:heme/copper-type cytochrome/quinol oxidase subunit 2